MTDRKLIAMAGNSMADFSEGDGTGTAIVMIYCCLATMVVAGVVAVNNWSQNRENEDD